MKQICLIGNIGNEKKTSSGQIIRTRILHDALTQKYGLKNVYVINTSEYSKNALLIIYKTIKSLFISKVYIVILSGNGRRFFFPILKFFKKFFGKIVLNNIVGGDYADSVKKYPKYIDYSNSFDVNWVQMKSMKNELEKIGIKNVEVLPNSKPLKLLALNKWTSRNYQPFQFCTFSRVSKEKGVELAINAIQNINDRAGKIIVELTIFGQVDDEYKEQFIKIMENSSEAIHYGGIVDYNKTTDVLKNYYMLLFPTTFYGEGFPGTILDSYASGLPVIAISWKFNNELVIKNKTGFIYEYDKPEQLEEYIIYSVCHVNEVEKMRNNCIMEAKKYIPENVMPIIFNKIDKYNNIVDNK